MEGFNISPTPICASRCLISYILVINVRRRRAQKDLAYLIVMDIFQCVADNTDPHVDQVRGGHFKDLLRELLTILVDLLHTRTQHSYIL